MQTFHSFLLRVQTQGRTSQNGQEHGNIPPKHLYWHFPEVLAHNGAFPCLQESSIFHPPGSHDYVLFLMPQKELKPFFRLKSLSEWHEEGIYQLSPREQTCHQGNNFGGAKAEGVFIRQRSWLFPGFLIDMVSGCNNPMVGKVYPLKESN